MLESTSAGYFIHLAGVVRMLEGFIDFWHAGWGAWIRTRGWRYQKPLPYHLATPQSMAGTAAL
jgi:hypothetical protein